MNELTPIENAVLSIVFHSQEQKVSLGDIIGGLEILSNKEYDSYALLTLLREMHKKQLIILRGITVALSETMPSRYAITALDSDTLQALQTPTSDKDPALIPVMNMGSLTNTEVNIITILQARNQRTTMNQIIKGLYKLTGRLYGRDSLVERLNAMSIRGILTREGARVRLADGIPLYREEDYKRLRRRKRRTDTVSKAELTPALDKPIPAPLPAH